MLNLIPLVDPAWANKQGIEDADIASLVENDKGIEEVQWGVDEASERLSRVEQVKKLGILPVAWEPGGDELVPTKKLKRKPIAESTPRRPRRRTRARPGPLMFRFPPCHFSRRPRRRRTCLVIWPLSIESSRGQDGSERKLLLRP